MIPVAVPVDAEHVVVDLLTPALVSRGLTATVGVNVPAAWTVESPSHVQVALDGTPEVTYPVLWRATVRVTCWASSPTAAKSLAALCQALLCAHEGSADVFSIRALTGVLPAVDPDTGAHLASSTVQANLRGSITP